MATHSRFSHSGLKQEPSTTAWTRAEEAVVHDRLSKHENADPNPRKILGLVRLRSCCCGDALMPGMQERRSMPRSAGASYRRDRAPGSADERSSFAYLMPGLRASRLA